MPILFHHPLCPLSRFARLALAEYGLDVDLIEEKVQDRREEFLLIDPAGKTPVLIADGGLVVPGAGPIAEWLDEAYGPSAPALRLMPPDIAGRVETRRLMDWFNQKMFAEATDWLVTQKVYKRFLNSAQGGGAPDMDLVRAARVNVRHHLGYIDFLVSERNWLAGPHMTFADLAAAAHISVADYLGDVPWAEFDHAKHWYQKVKCRPSFRSLLADRMLGMAPSAVYADLDF